jgi:uncharacterized protein YihD (DUF1040 family)
MIFVFWFVALFVVGFIVFMVTGRPEDLKHRRLKKAIDTLLVENAQLKTQVSELTDQVLGYKIKLEAAELGLPFPTIEEEERQIQRVLKNIEISMQEDPGGNAKGE